MQYLDHQKVLKLLPDRQANSHKGDYGKILLICGSRGYTGAAALACMGALRSGAGLVYLAVPDCIYDIEAIKLTEPVIIPLPDRKGMLDESAIEEVFTHLPRMDALLIGPGLGISSGTEKVVCSVLKQFKGPVVLDADGINVLSRHKDILRERIGQTIITPHEGEFVRFGGFLDHGRIFGAKTLASDLNCIVVLKGNNTVITDGTSVFINKTGNPGMATGGSGDVLAGIITSLLGQKLDPLQAAACGVWLHGAAGDLCAAHMGAYAMLPSDMVQYLSKLMK